MKQEKFVLPLETLINKEYMFARYVHDVAQLDDTDFYELERELKLMMSVIKDEKINRINKKWSNF